MRSPARAERANLLTILSGTDETVSPGRCKSLRRSVECYGSLSARGLTEGGLLLPSIILIPIENERNIYTTAWNQRMFEEFRDVTAAGKAFQGVFEAAEKEVK